MTDYAFDDLNAALEYARAAHPELTQLLDLHGAILAAQRGVQAALPTWDTAGDPMRLLEGKPALTFDHLGRHWGHIFAGLWQQCDEIARHYHIDWSRAATPVASVESVRSWFDGVSPTDERVDFLIRAALRPFLSHAAEALLPHVNRDLWGRGQCLVCGSEPDFAFLDNDRGARHLVCACCDATWLFKRLECPFCGNSDPQRLAYYASDGEVYRLYVCDACRHYIKAIDLRQARHRVIWGVERVATAGMDAAAVSAGYH